MGGFGRERFLGGVFGGSEGIERERERCAKSNVRRYAISNLVVGNE